MTVTSHHGSIVFRERFGRVIATEIRYENVRHIARHAHSDAAFCLVLSGSYEERFGSARLAARPSTVLFRPAGEVHEDVIEEKVVCCFIAETSPEWIAQSIGPRLTTPTVERNHQAAAAAWRPRQEAHEPDDLTPLAVEALINELFVACARQSGRADSRLARRAADLLDDRFRESISLRDVAAALETPAAHLASEFRLAHGCSVGDYIRQRRVECAAAMLRRAEAPLADVALAAGFAHQSHFCRVFKRFLGVTPAVYRRQTK